MEIVDGFLNGGDAGAEADAFEACSNLHEALGIFATNFSLSLIGGEGGQRAESGGASSGTDNRGVHHLLERGTAGVRKTNADGIDAIVENDGSGGRFALEDR